MPRWADPQKPQGQSRKQERQADGKGGWTSPRIDGSFQGGPQGARGLTRAKDKGIHVGQGAEEEGGRTLGPLNSFLILKSLCLG